MTRALLALALFLGACASDAPADDVPVAEDAVQTDGDAFLVGETVPDGDALTPATLIADADAYAGRTVLVEGTAREVCQMAGCWLSFGDDQGRTVRIEVPRDESESYVFTFPKDAGGKTVRVQGTLAVETESVEDLRHYAEDGGATQAELDAITEPQQTLVLTAAGAEIVGATGEPPADDSPSDDDAA